MQRPAGRAITVRGTVGAVTAGVVAITTIGLAPAAAKPTNLPARIDVQNSQITTVDGIKTRTVPDTFLGANQRWPDDGKGVWDSKNDRPEANFVSLAEQTGLRSLRYPGGTIANTFDFTKAIGPQDQRGCQTSGGFANGVFESTDSRFGVDENERLADAIGGETQVMVPMINQNADDAANYVEYMNSVSDGNATNPNGGTDWAEIRASNGHAQPYDIEYFEVGNEPYVKDQRYWRAENPQTALKQYIEGGWQRQKAEHFAYKNNDGLFATPGCDLATRMTGDGTPDQDYRTRFAPIALPGDEENFSGVGDGPVTEPVLRVGGQEWTRVTSLDSAGPTDRVYVINKANGTVHFGDGQHGAVPAKGVSLSFDYTTGGHDGFTTFERKMKEVDPDIKVCSAWGKPEFVNAMGSKKYDCIGHHSYSSPNDDLNNPDPDRYYDNLQKTADSQKAGIVEMRRSMGTAFPDPDDRPELLITEYGGLIGARRFAGDLQSGLKLSSLVMSMLENDVPISMSSNTSGLPLSNGEQNLGELFGSAPLFMTGRAKMLSMFKDFEGATLLDSSIAGNPTRSSTRGDYTTLRTLTGYEDGIARTLIVNRDPEQGIPTRIDIDNASATGEVEISTLTGDSVDSYVQPTDPDGIRIEKGTVDTKGGGIELTLAPHSVTLLEYKVRTPGYTTEGPLSQRGHRPRQ